MESRNRCVLRASECWLIAACDPPPSPAAVSACTCVRAQVTKDCADICERYSGFGAFGNGLAAVNLRLSSDAWSGKDFCRSSRIDPLLEEEDEGECTCDCLKSCDCLYPMVTPAIGEDGSDVAIGAVLDYESVSDKIGDGKYHRKTNSLGLPAGTTLPDSCDVCADISCSGYVASSPDPDEGGPNLVDFCCNSNYCDVYNPSCLAADVSAWA